MIFRIPGRVYFTGSWLMTLGLSATSAARAQTAAVPLWRTAAQPSATIGGRGAEPAADINRVSSAHRIGAGLVVANADPMELRLYNAQGKLIRTIGRGGEGPGEFRTGVQVDPWRGDSILAYNGGNARWSLFRADGTLVREWPGPTNFKPSDIVSYRQVFTVRRTNSMACVEAVVDQLPAPISPAQLRELVVDGAGRYWLRGVGAPEWTVYSASGKAIGRVRLPPDGTLLEAAHGTALVVRTDQDDVERIEVWPVSMPEGTPARQPCQQVSDSVTAPSASGRDAAMLKTDLRNLQTLGDAFHQKYCRYPATLADINAMHFSFSGPPADLEWHPVVTTSRGWGSMLTNTRSGLFCISVVGVGAIPGWPAGQLSCGSVKIVHH
jgi:hypothetical protein